MEELEALIILNNLPQLGSMKIRQLMRFYGSAAAALNAPLEELVYFPTFGPLLVQNLKIALEKKEWHNDLKLAGQTQAEIVPFTSSHYPKRLLEIDDFPVLLYTQGTLHPQDHRCLAIVGTRQASIYGLEMARNISGELAKGGYTIVSGFARGIDTAAHEGALPCGRTLAVLGSGLTRPYPKENIPLGQTIKKQGAMISEFPMAAPPSQHHFPKRNRIVSGMTLGTIVIEAPLKSGAMLTAQLAIDQGRPVFALPGRCDQENHRGNHHLIKEGKAKLVENGGDILKFFDDCPLQFTFGASKKPQIHLEKEELELLEKMPAQESSVEELAVRFEWPVGKLNGLLMSLVLKKVIREYPGKIYKKI